MSYIFEALADVRLTTENIQKVIGMYPRDNDWKKLITKHRRDIDALRKGKDLPKKVEDELMKWALDNGEIKSDDVDELDDFIDGIINEGTVNENPERTPAVKAARKAHKAGTWDGNVDKEGNPIVHLKGKPYTVVMENLEEALVKVTDVEFNYRDQLPNSPQPSDLGAIANEWKQDRMALRDAIKRMGGLVTNTIAPSRGTKWVGTVTIGTRGDASKLDDKSIQNAVKKHGIEIHSDQFRESTESVNENYAQDLDLAQKNVARLAKKETGQDRKDYEAVARALNQGNLGAVKRVIKSISTKEIQADILNILVGYNDLIAQMYPKATDSKGNLKTPMSVDKMIKEDEELDEATPVARDSKFEVMKHPSGLYSINFVNVRNGDIFIGKEDLLRFQKFISKVKV